MITVEKSKENNTNDLHIQEYLDSNKYSCICKSNNKDIHQDRKGQKFNKLTILEYIGKGAYKCKCDCGNYTHSKYYNLTIGRTKSCGKCGIDKKIKSNKSTVYKDITDEKFGRLTAKIYLGNGLWSCLCDCGNNKKVHGTMLRCGNTKSCGCLTNKQPNNLQDKQFGEWSVLEYCGKSMWKCECSCGTIRKVHAYSLKNSKSTNCGLPIHRYIDLKNKIFGELTVLKYKNYGIWECKCSCGNIVNVLGTNLRNNSTKSCGCKTVELLQSTLLNKYGDIAPNKVENPRKCIQTLLNKEIMEKIINKKYPNKINIDELCDTFDTSKVTLLKYVKLYNLLDRIEFNNGNTSKIERDIRKFIENTGYKTIYNSKNIIYPLELDIYIPEKKLAIEFNGNYWHSTIYKDKYYHQNKTIACAKQGIRLIHIFEYEWKDKEIQNKIKNMLNNILHDKIVVYARNTIIKEIDNLTSNSFLEKYHLQECTKSSIHLGCYHKNELLGVMTFGKPRFNFGYEYELHRLCFKHDINIIGGTEKLFKYFIKNYNPTSIITYSDISKFTGNTYLKLGFKPIQPKPITEPNYIWVNPKENEILTRYQTQKHKLIKLGLGMEEQTEEDIMESLGFLRIYDSGNIRLEYKT